jgi:hypothetical protein
MYTSTLRTEEDQSVYCEATLDRFLNVGPHLKRMNGMGVRTVAINAMSRPAYCDPTVFVSSQLLVVWRCWERSVPDLLLWNIWEAKRGPTAANMFRIRP